MKMVRWELQQNVDGGVTLMGIFGFNKKVWFVYQEQHTKNAIWRIKVTKASRL